jgi:Zn-dependent protease with chaperone function
MDFFGRQLQARRNTFWLVVLYGMAVACIIGAVYLAVELIFTGAAAKMRTAGPQLWNPELFGWVAGGTLLLVSTGTLWKIAELAGGGAVVARMLGGRELSPSTRDPAERRLMNVVEEMAIAAGMPVPQVFVMDDEEGINAFAAGTAPANAVVAVTRGCLRALSRDELQGVVGHEFSHILNGDMRLNIRMIGVLNGILLIALVGRGILRGMGNSRVSSGRDKKGGGGAIILLALALLVIGWIGVFFARLIQAAVSRQREYLADASAVQFTRNPAGLAGALKKIAGFDASSRIESPNAAAASHMFFADGVASWFNLFATHPPLEERIHLLDPAFDGKIPRCPDGYTDAEIAAAEPHYGAQPPAIPGFAPPSVRRSIPFTPREVMPQVGMPVPEHLGYAQAMLSALPPDLVQAAHEADGVAGVVYGMLLDRDAVIREKQYTALESAGVPAPVVAWLHGSETVFLGLPRAAKLPLAQVALPALRLLPADETARFLDATGAMVDADGNVDLFEYMLRRMLARRLGGSGEAAGRRTERHVLLPLLPECQKVLSLLAWVGTEVPEAARRAFADGVRELAVTPAPELLPAELCGLAEVDKALGELESAAPALKRRILAACIACIGSDGVATEAEAELLRAVADSLDCPIPPLSATPATVAAAA